MGRGLFMYDTGGHFRVCLPQKATYMCVMKAKRGKLKTLTLYSDKSILIMLKTEDIN